MYSATFNVVDIAVGCYTNELSILQVLDQTFERAKSPASISVLIEVGSTDRDDVFFDHQASEVHARFTELGDIEGYGYHNATKWLLRAAAWMLEKRRVLCLHAAGAVWHDLGVLIVGRTARGGKTTLSLSIAIRGGQFVADEYLFYDGQHCYGCPQFKSHVRFGTLLAFPELEDLVPDAVSPDRLELWDVALGCPLNLSEICGPGRVASKMVPRVILFPSLDPEASISMREIHRTEAMSLLRAESVKHIAKLWLAPGTEIGSPEEVDEIVDKLGRAGIEVSGREMMLSELVDHLPCFALSGGSNLSSLLQETERIVLSLRE